MVRRDKHKIERRYRCTVPLDGFFSRKLRVFASWFNHRNIWIVIGHLCASFCQQLHQRITGRLALIIDVRLIGQTQNQNLGAVDGLASRVERICDRAHNMLGHARIDLAGQLNETRMLTIFASLPCEIKWIDGDAMPAKPRAGIKRHETKWLRLGGFDDLPDVNSHGAVQDRKSTRLNSSHQIISYAV